MSQSGRRWLDQPWTTELEVEVKAVEAHGDGALVLTAQTIFFPGGGGQPADGGRVGDQPLLGLVEREGAFGHVVAEAPAGDRVTLSLDVAPRLDVAQQHSGQHLLSAVCFQNFGFQTLSFHLGDEVSTIDIDTKPLAEDVLARIEEEVNRLARARLAIRGTETSPDGAAAMEILRKLPAVEEDLRIVTIEGLDAVPCCGTHLSNTAEVAPVLLLEQSKMRGKARLHFVCGARAIVRARRDRASLSGVARSLGIAPASAQERCKELQ